MKPFRTTSYGNPRKVAGAIADRIYKEGTVEIEAIGAGAISTAVKAVAIASEFVQEKDYNIAFSVSWYDADVNGEEKSGIRFKVFTI